MSVGVYIYIYGLRAARLWFARAFLGFISPGSCVCNQQSEGSNLQSRTSLCGYRTARSGTVLIVTIDKTSCELHRGCSMCCHILSVYRIMAAEADAAAVPSDPKHQLDPADNLAAFALVDEACYKTLI